MKLSKKLLSLLLCAVMVLGSVAIGGNGFAEVLDALSVKASAVKVTSYKTGDIIEFGWYPQSKVTNSNTISALNGMAGDDRNWNSYNYYSGTDDHDDGQMTPSNYMRYTDVMYGSTKYRGVILDKYRPYSTGCTSSAFNSLQSENGYNAGTVYWFKYEPIKWRVLDPATGMVMAETILDSQAFNNYFLSSGRDEYGYTAYWGDSSKTYYANNYTESSIRKWLNDDFYNTAFSSAQQNIIQNTALDNSAYSTSYSEYNSESTNDKIYLLSWNDALNTSYGFSSSNSTSDTSRIAKGSDYAKCQSLFDGNTYWRLRSPGSFSGCVCLVGSGGGVYYSYSTNFTYYGVRPALNFNLSSDIFQYHESYNDSYNSVTALDTNTFSINVKTNALLSGSLTNVSDAVVEISDGRKRISGRTDSNGNISITQKELTGFGFTSSPSSLTVTAKRQIGNDLYLVPYDGSKYYLSDFKNYSSGRKYINLNKTLLQPVFNVAYSTERGEDGKHITSSIINSYLSHYIDYMYRLTWGLVKPVINTNYLVYSSDSSLRNSTADIKFYLNHSNQSNPGGYSHSGNKNYSIDMGLINNNGGLDDPLTLCHETMHYVFGVYDEYCNGYNIINRKSFSKFIKDNNYAIDFNNNGQLENYWLYWTNDKNLLSDGMHIVNSVYLNKLKVKYDSQLSQNGYDAYNRNACYFYADDSAAWSKELVNNTVDIQVIIEETGTYWYYEENGNAYQGIFKRPNTTFGIMGPGDEQTLSNHVSTSDSYNYLLNSEFGGSKKVDTSNPQWYTAQYYNYSCSVYDMILDYISGASNYSFDYDILFQADENQDMPTVVINEEINGIEINAETEIEVDAVAQTLQSAEEVSADLTDILFSSNGESVTVKTNSIDENTCVILRYYDNNNLIKKQFEANNDIYSTSFLNEDLMEIYYLFSDNGKLCYCTLEYDTLDCNNSGGAQTTSLGTVETYIENYEDFEIITENNNYSSGTYFSVAKPVNIIKSSNDEIEDESFVQTINKNLNVDLTTVSVFFYDGTQFVPTESSTSFDSDSEGLSIAYGYMGDGKYVIMAEPAKESDLSPVTGLNVAKSQSGYEGELTVSFSDNNAFDSEASYNLYYSDEPFTSTDNIEYKSLSIGKSTYDISFSEGYNTYYFALEILDKNGGKSPLSECVSFELSPNDSDDDGIPDYWFNQYPALKDIEDVANVDSDEDGLTNLEEFQLGTNPINADTDGDNVFDAIEIQNDLNPLEPMTDGITDDYVLVYGNPDAYIDTTSYRIDGETAVFIIANNTDGKAMRTRIRLYNAAGDLVEMNEVNLDANSTVEYSFSSEYFEDGMRITLDEEHITRDADYSNNEFVYCKADSISAVRDYRFVKIGSSIQLEYTLCPTSSNECVTWCSDNDAVASVTSTGIVVGKSSGYATITAVTVSGLSCSYTISVAEPEKKTSISFEGSSREIKEGEVIYLNPIIQNPNYYDVVWTCNSSKITIEEQFNSCVVTGISPGRGKINVSLIDSDGKTVAEDSITINVKPNLHYKGNYSDTNNEKAKGFFGYLLKIFAYIFKECLPIFYLFD